MNQIAFIIAVSAVTFVIGRSIRDIIRKRPVREKKARRKMLNRFFAFISLVLVVALVLAISIVGGVMVFTEGLETDIVLLLVIILGFSGYLSFEIVKYLKNN
jgi:cytochrome c biogenesis protein CcdA